MGQSFEKLNELFEKASKSQILSKEIAQLKSIEQLPEKPIYVTPVEVDNLLYNTIGYRNQFKKCSNCGFGFIVKNDTYTLYLTNSNRVVTCPKCGNTEQIF